MLKSKKVLAGVAALGLVSLGLSLCGVTYAADTRGEAQIENPSDPTVPELAAYLQEKHDQEALENELLDESGEQVRIKNFDPASAANRIVIRVHKSATPANPEYLEVFRQRSADPNDLDPILVFEDGQSNRALVSTAGTFGGRLYTTPSGNFAIDSLEEMHYSRTYNNAPMPWTMFFNGGIAIHGATPSEFNQLGRKASHGCVRVHPANARLLFDFVRNDGRRNVVIQVIEQ